jgi:hypothetical protein
MVKLGLTLQWVGFTVAAAAYLLIWLLRPHDVPGPIPALSPDGGPYKPAHVTPLFGVAIAAIGLASLRWRWAGIALLLVAISASWYAITNHAMQWSHVVFPPWLTYGPVVVVGLVVALVGLAIRTVAVVARSKAA